MLRRKDSRPLLLVLVILVQGCSSENRPTLTITGATTISPLMAAIGERYEKEHPDVRIDVHTGGSSRGIADVGYELADIGMSSRALNESEKDGREMHVLARDGVAFVVHKSNPITALANGQLRKIYTGEITNWQQVGGNKAEITVINRAEGRSELVLVTDLFKIKSSQIKPDVIAGANQEGIKLVAGDPNAIIYISLGKARYEADRGVTIKLLPFDWVEATVENVRSGKYGFSRPLVLITRPSPYGLVKEFLDYALSDKVHDLVREYEFVPIK